MKSRKNLLKRLILTNWLLLFLAVPAYGQNALNAEGVAEEVLPFTGKLINHGSPLFPDRFDFISLENFRYYSKGIASRQGMAKKTSSVLESPVTRIIPFTSLDTYLFAVNDLADFDLFTEVDPNSGVTITNENKITFNVNNNESAYVYYDMGQNYFDGNFEFRNEGTVNSADTGGESFVWGLANDVNDLNSIDGAGGDYLGLIFRKDASNYSLYLTECVAGTLYSQNLTVSSGVTYYTKIWRDESTGTYGSLYCNFYADEERASLTGTLGLTLHAKKDFRYLYAFSTFNTGGAPEILGSTENLWIADNTKDCTARYYTEFQDGLSSSTAYQTDGTGKITYAKVYDTLVVADGSDLWAYSGATVYPKMLLYEKTADVLINAYDWIYDNASHTVSSGETVYIGYPRTFDDVQTDKDNAWTGTASGTSPAYKGGYFMYWATISGSATIEMPKIETSPTTLTGNLWGGGQQMFAQEFIVQESSTSPFKEYSYWVRNSSTETYADISELTSGSTIFMSFPFQPWQIKLFLPENNKNETAITLTGKYWDGDSWTTLSSFSDGTSSNSACFGQTGILTYTMPSNWEQRTVGNALTEGYAIALNLSGTIDNYVRVYKVIAIPYPDTINDEHWKMVGSYQDRLILADGDDKSIVRISAQNLPDTFVGFDSTYAIVGSRSDWIGMIESPDAILFMKKDGNYLMTGVNPSTFEVRKLPGMTPGIAPYGFTTIDRPEGVYVVYMASDGIYMLSPQGANIKLSEDVKAYWETGNDLEIPSPMIDKAVAWFDKYYNEVSFAVGDGGSATALTHELRYNLDEKKWSVFERATNKETSTAIGFINEDNQYTTLSGAYNGYIYTLESGSDDDGTDITCTVERKPLVLKGSIAKSELVGTALRYDLPSGTTRSVTFNITPGIQSTVSEESQAKTLTDEGWYKLPRTSTDQKGFYHKFEWIVTGQIRLWTQIIWSRPCEWDRN